MIIEVLISQMTHSLSIYFQSLNSILMASDASELPVTDFEAASSLPYDTDIPDGKFNKPCLFFMLVVIKICLFVCTRATTIPYYHFLNLKLMLKYQKTLRWH